MSSGPCGVNHRTYRALAKCIWPRAAWVHGDGSCAVLAHCRTLTVTLHQEHEDAEASKEFIDKYACGGKCSGNHEIVVLDLRRHGIGA